MTVFAANLTMMFTEWSFGDRFAAAADAGFTAVECLFPYSLSAVSVAEKLRANGLTQALFNLPAGDWDAGERGLAALPGRYDDFVASVGVALEYAEATGVGRVHMMSGLADPRDAQAEASYVRALNHAAERFAAVGVDLLIEPINGRNMPGYFLNDFDRAAGYIEQLALPGVKLQFDVYHRQIIHGDVTMALRRLLSIIGHIQVASVPSRHEPDGEELNYPFLFEELDRLGYTGFVGCEYLPRGATLDGLAWFERYRAKR